MTGTAEITIKVSDVQDTPPRFQRLPYLFAIKENSSWVGSNILAQDGDRGFPRDITYSLYNDSQCSSLFTLDNRTGKLSLKDGRVLDRDTGVLKEKQGVCRLQIKASEVISSGEPTVNSTANTTVTVTVEDIDDNVPTFSLSHYNASVDEEVSNIPLTINGAVGINVSDLDQGKNSEFDLTVNYANGTKCTGIESTPSHVIGQATVLLRLVHGFKFDYETEEMVELQVVATGKVNNSMTTTCTVTVNINNTNDNDPVFDQSDYNAIIAENPEHGTSVIVVTAKDDDKGKYGNLNYTLKGSSLFAIDPQNGTVYTNGSPGDLDRETRDTYYLTVVVTDGGGKRAVVSLTVTLSDVNDNRPKFIYTTVEMSINENTTTFTPNIAIKANDNDEPGTNNSMVRYRLDIPDPNLQSNFTINDTTGELIATEPLDYENLTYPSENGQIRLIVIAYDLGTPSLESNITVIINAHDENDNTPKFLNDDYNASIPENSKQGHPVKNVSAEDDDATSPNNVTRYYIEKGGSDKFRIDAIKGIITVDLNARFDRETQDLYILTVIAADIGTPPLTGTVNVSVIITDVNDEKPNFGESQYTRGVKENITVGTIIKTYNATDVDKDSNLEYIILGIKATDIDGDSVNRSLIENMFDVVSDNGSVFVSSELDRETASQVDITLLVNDTMCAENCPQNDTTTLTITVEDVNDVAPQFSQDVYEVAIPESYAIGRVVITLTATDVDITGDGPFYTVVSDPYSSFTIKEKRTGTITTTRNLDRETHPVHNITVSASDGVNNSTAIVIINVTDVNDNAPQFLPFDSTVNITEGNYTDNSMWVARVNATDADEGENATVKYRLPPNHNNFWINESTGDIYAVGVVDREAEKDGKIKLTIIAENSDKDPESLRNTTELILLILDVNDNRPEFSGTTYHGSGQETEVKNGTWLLQVTATDSDNGLNGTDGITYEIEQNTNGTDFFYINDTNGMIYANDEMVDNVGTFLLNVTARDGGHPSLMSSVEVFIEIVDENNNQPEFKIDKFMFSILECERPGINITRIAATDKDKGLNGKIMFSLTREPGSGPLPFTIGKDNGQISLNRSVTNKERPEYKFQINATDLGSPIRLTTLSSDITIQIRDVNDKPPQFPQPTRIVSVMENTNDTVVTTVEAFDNDSDSITTYSINNYGKYHQYFHVNKTTGVVTIVKALDRETTPFVEIKVVATDASLRNETCNRTEVIPVAINDTQILRVDLDDQNDSPPVFTQKVFRTGVRKNIKLNTEIFDFVGKVTDKDSETYSIHSFKIVGDMEMPQKITDATGKASQCAESKVKRPVCLSSNGTITTNMLFEEAMEGTITFQVLARDIAGNDTAYLNIDIIVDNQMAKMVFQGSKQEVENIKTNVTGELTNLTGMIFVPDEVNVYTRDDGIVDSSRSILTFYVKDPSTGRILTASEIKQLVDRFGSQLISIQLKYRLLSVEEAFKEPLKEENGEFKQKMILAGATILEAIIICILIVVACRSQGKFKRKLKAATVTTKDEKDSGEKKNSIVPGSNVYASITNPILNKDVPLPVMTEIDTLSDTDSQNSLDLNEVGAEGMTPDYRTTEEKEAVMDMYTEDFYTADTDTDPLQMVLAMHEREKAQNGHVTQMNDMEDESEFHLDFDNPALTLETTEV
ncbi:cadherin-23-like [Argopecten irradians]|uniref:cadherin-23-like n=1 Tax=Argopecten irradians TaxID=31199 RepID=UPI003714999A